MSEVEKYDWAQWVLAGRGFNMSPRDVFDLTPASFLDLLTSSTPPSKRIMSRRLMLNMIRQNDGRP